jgi:hypothetical protein
MKLINFFPSKKAYYVKRQDFFPKIFWGKTIYASVGLLRPHAKTIAYTRHSFLQWKRDCVWVCVLPEGLEEVGVKAC